MSEELAGGKLLLDEPAEAVVSFDLVDLGCCATGEWS